MKKYIFISILFLFLLMERGYSQGPFFTCGNAVIPASPPVTIVKNGVTYWYGKQAKEVVDTAELIFEGRVLNDSSFFYRGGYKYISHRVLVLKKFKGDFNSDTVIVVNAANIIGRLGEQPTHVSIGDEDVFFVTKKNFWHLPFYFIGYRPHISLITVCDKKDMVKDIYEPIEAVTGQPYVEVHPNNCATQQKSNK